MRLNLGCRLGYRLYAPTPMILLLNTHYSRASDLERPDLLTVTPSVPIAHYRDGFGNWCARLVAPEGQVTVSTNGIIRDDGRPDPAVPGAAQLPVESLPSEVIRYLLPSRFCDSDLLLDFAWSNFGNGPTGWQRVQAVSDFVHRSVSFNYGLARPTRTAADTLREGVGVCRDFTHLGIALCRALNIPARYCTGYISDMDQPLPHSEMDFCAWMEVYLDGAWHTFDPRNNVPRVGRVLVARGFDAADVPLTHTFGRHDLTEFKVWIDPIGDEDTAAA